MFTYLSKKLEMSGGANVRCLAWSAVDSYLACGCDNGLLKVLKIEVTTPKDDKGQPLTPRGYLAVPTNITMNQTLDGHTSPVQVISWNNPYNKLTTSDAKGLIVVWMLYKSQWYEEMVNNRNKSTVRGLAWSNNGEKICIVYEDGGVIVGSADGNRLWSKELKGSPLCGVTWSPDGNQLLFPVGSGEIHVYDNEGNYQTNVKLNGLETSYSSSGHEIAQSVVALSWYVGNATVSIKLPTLAIVFKRNALNLLRGISDSSPVVLETNIVATCGDWSPNGDYFAIGGEPLVKKPNDPPMDLVVIFSAAGKFLHQIRIPSQPCMSLAWDSWSLRLAVGAGPNIYFANIRPNYKLTFYAEHIFVYAFGRADGSSHIAFWDQNKLNTQEIPGIVVDLKGNDDLCAVMTCSRSSTFNVALVNAVGAPVDNITITTIEPFILVLTETTVCCVAPNAVLIWKYQIVNAAQNDIFGSRKRETTFHLDDVSKNSAGSEMDGDLSSRETSDLLKRTTKDPAVCADGVKHILVVVRDSGKIMLYSLPHGTFITCMESIHDMNIRPRRVFVNMDGTQVALLDTIGSLATCYVSAGSNLRGAGVVKTYDRKDVWDVMWARDNPTLMCAMEKTRLYVIENGKLEDPIISSAYLGYFKNLQVTSVLMDEIMQDPEDPKPDMVLKFETKALRDMKQLIENNTPLLDIMSYIEENSHPLLWRLMAQAALQFLNLQIAETAFVKCKDYAGVQFTKRILSIPDKLVQQAEVACFFEEYEKAEKLYLQADRRDLATEMWQLLGDWKRVEQVAVSQSKQKPSQKAISEMNLALGDLYAEKFEWNKARIYYEQADHSDRVFDCYLILEDYKKLQYLAESSPPTSEIVPKIAEIFGSVGLCDDSVKAYLHCEMYEEAVKIAMTLGEWNLAMELAAKYNMDTGAVLAQYASYLITEGNIFQAVELFKSSNKPYSAAKIIGMMALHELECEDMEPLIVKMLFVLCALLFEYKGKDYDFVNTPGSTTIKHPGLTTFSDDISFDMYIPENYRPPPEVYNWMRSNPWRGAEAIHYYLMAARYLYTGQFSQATRCSLQLTSYADILGEERVGTLIATSAANSRNYGICSRAFMFLEEIDESFSEESAALFSRHQPVDSHPMKSECEKCMAAIPDGVQRCPECNEPYPFCIAKGKSLSLRNSGIWVCEVCKHMADEEAMQEKLVCPLCHALKLKSAKAKRKDV